MAKKSSKPNSPQPAKAKGTRVAQADGPNPLQPAASLLIKLGSCVVHADELLSPHGHAVDRVAFDGLLADAEVQAWIEQMTKLAFLPVKRNK